jgi:uncharacterized cupredoxin-like copper-binding protein
MRVVSRRMNLLAVWGLVSTLLIALPATADEHHTKSEPPVEVPASGKVTVIAKEFKFLPSAIQLRKGQRVTIVFKNEGRLSHSLTIPDLGLRTDTIQSGAQATIEFTAKEAGRHAFWCTVPGHKQAGMAGEVAVIE